VLSEEFGWLGVLLVLGCICSWSGAAFGSPLALATATRAWSPARSASAVLRVCDRQRRHDRRACCPWSACRCRCSATAEPAAVSLLAGLGVVMAVQAHRPVHSR
jgi:hypothetical protein